MTKLDFSDDDRYVEMCSQAIDKDNNIDNMHINKYTNNISAII